jgi:hypothetical protein
MVNFLKTVVIDLDFRELIDSVSLVTHQWVSIIVVDSALRLYWLKHKELSVQNTDLDNVISIISK